MGESMRRLLTAGDQLDIPLLRSDGSLHVVELKTACISKLIRKHRGTREPADTPIGLEEVPLIVGTDVNEAVSQTMNYLCHLDESRDHILSRFKIDTRRATATVLVGHPEHLDGEITADQVASTLRIYNSHLSRIEVMHYQELIENAERALALAADVEDEETREHELAERQEKPDSGPDTDGDPWAQPDDDPWVRSEPWSDDDAPF